MQFSRKFGLRPPFTVGRKFRNPKVGLGPLFFYCSLKPFPDIEVENSALLFVAVLRPLFLGHMKLHDRGAVAWCLVSAGDGSEVDALSDDLLLTLNCAEGRSLQRTFFGEKTKLKVPTEVVTNLELGGYQTLFFRSRS